MGDRNQPLAVELHGETLSITIGVSTLAQALLSGHAADAVERGEVMVPDEYGLACSTIMELRRPYGPGVFALALLINAAERGASNTGAIQYGPATPAVRRI